jgi:fumarate reductase (CoM/CoB) subunit A
MPGAEIAVTDVIDYDTDVLVAGAGAAGVEAAIKARENGATVVIITKNWFGRGGSSAILSSGWVLDKVNPDEMVAATNGLADRTLCEAISRTMSSSSAALETENNGSLFLRQRDGKALLTDKAYRNGYRLSHFVYRALKLGANVIDNTMVTNFLIHDHQIAGAIALNFHTGRLYVIRAKSVVLATGGMGEAIGGPGTTNASGHGGSSDRTGDGQVLAYKAGAELQNLEFRSLERGWIYPTQTAGINAYGTRGPVLDKFGKEVMKEAPHDQQRLRHELIETARAVSEGRGTPHGGVYVNYEPFLPDYAGDWIDFFVNASNVVAKHWRSNGLDTTKVETGWTFNMEQGGLVINEKAETTIPGLYACGETTGIGGPGYIGGGCLGISCITIGSWAGQNAAARAKTTPAPDIDWTQVRNERGRVDGILENRAERPIRPFVVRRAIQEATWKGGGPLRSRKKCIEAIAEFERIRKEDLPRMSTLDKSRVCNLEWREALELLNMLDAGEMIVRSALARTESRGTHCREEYDGPDDSRWLKTIHIRKVDDRMTVFEKPVAAAKPGPQAGSVE